jgi:hypothetical protein
VEEAQVETEFSVDRLELLRLLTHYLLVVHQQQRELERNLKSFGRILPMYERRFKSGDLHAEDALRSFRRQKSDAEVRIEAMASEEQAILRALSGLDEYNKRVLPQGEEASEEEDFSSTQTQTQVLMGRYHNALEMISFWKFKRRQIRDIISTVESSPRSGEEFSQRTLASLREQAMEVDARLAAIRAEEKAITRRIRESNPPRNRDR